MKNKIPLYRTQNYSAYNIPKNYLEECKKQQPEKFKWTIVYDEYIPQKTCKKESFKKFLEETIQSLNKYEKYFWDDLEKMKNSHKVLPTQHLLSEETIKNILKRKQKDVLIYQIKGHSLKHRIFGYREHGVFHVMLNDLNHEQTPD